MPSDRICSVISESDGIRFTFSEKVLGGRMRVKLANCLLGGDSVFQNYPSMLYRTNSGTSSFRSEDSSLILIGGEFDFTTYFNAFSVFKWLKYTVARSFFLHLEYIGSAFKLSECFANSYGLSSQIVEDGEHDAPVANEWVSLDIPLKQVDSEVLHAFSIKTSGEVRIRNAYYYTDVDQSLIRNVELAIASTTFKKEDYVRKNIRLIQDGVLSSDERIANHLTLHVVDNGRTLSAEDGSSDRIQIHQNPNVGGSGGFAYGMILAMEQSPKATHVLLMDDDVSVLPESFIRTFNLLSLLKDDYQDAFLSGAMMSLEEPNLRTEDLGFFTSTGNFSPLKPSGYMTNLHDVVETEVYTAPTDSWVDTKQQYVGWWYCAIPVSTIEKCGLPLPLFVRSDDAEYSLRCNPRFMTMNGICVWHNEFRYKYSAAVERYQVSRNTLICQATTGMAPLSDFLKEIHHEVQLDLKKFNYDDAALAVKGLEDFLRGPEFIKHPVAERRFIEANKEKEKLVPLEDLLHQARELGVDLENLSEWNLNCGGPRGKVEAAKDLITFNGQRFVDESKSRKGKVAVIDAAGWVYPSAEIRDVDTLIVVDMANKKGAIRHYDKERFKQVWSRYKKAAKEFKANKTHLYAEYAACRDELTSVGFWKKYLAEADSQ